MRKSIGQMALVGIMMLTVACGGKKQSEDIITERVEKPQPQAPIRTQEDLREHDVRWIGRNYHLVIRRQASDSLPMVADEIGQKFVDNVVTLSVIRQDGSVFFHRQFAKSHLEKYLDDDYRATGILEGFVFTKAEGDYLVFAASVCHPQTDEYIPLVVKLSRMGDVVIKRDTEMDTSARDYEEDGD